MKTFFKKNTNNKKGFLVLTMVLLVCAAVLIIVTGALLRSISQVQGSADSENSLKAWSAVNACGEYALLQMIASTTSTTTTAANWAYSGGEPLENVGGGEETCYINTVTNDDTAKVVTASSTVSGFTRKIRLEVATNTPNIVINSWEYVADFE
jgi:type II secretory pathway component PulK